MVQNLERTIVERSCLLLVKACSIFWGGRNSCSVMAFSVLFCCFTFSFFSQISQYIFFMFFLQKGKCILSCTCTSRVWLQFQCSLVDSGVQSFVGCGMIKYTINLLFFIFWFNFLLGWYFQVKLVEHGYTKILRVKQINYKWLVEKLESCIRTMINDASLHFMQVHVWGRRLSYFIFSVSL